MNIHAKMEKPSLGRVGIFNYGMFEMLRSVMCHTYVGSCRIQSAYLVVVWFIFCIKTEGFFFILFNIGRELI